MSQFLLALYERLVLRHPVIVLVLLAVLTAGAVSQLGKLRISSCRSGRRLGLPAWLSI